MQPPLFDRITVPNISGEDTPSFPPANTVDALVVVPSSIGADTPSHYQCFEASSTFKVNNDTSIAPGNEGMVDPPPASRYVPPPPRPSFPLPIAPRRSPLVPEVTAVALDASLSRPLPPPSVAPYAPPPSLPSTLLPAGPLAALSPVPDNVTTTTAAVCTNSAKKSNCWTDEEVDALEVSKEKFSGQSSLFSKIKEDPVLSIILKDRSITQKKNYISYFNG